MIAFANEHWDTKSYDMQNLQLSLLGIYRKELFWDDSNFVPIINDLVPSYLNWAKRFIKNHDYINNFLAFCASTAGAPLLKDGLIIIADALEGSILWHAEQTSLLIVELCKKIWSDYHGTITNSPEFEDAFWRILSKSISLGSREALDLQNEINMSSA